MRGLVVLAVLWSLAVTPRALTDYACPGHCFCATIDTIHLDLIQLVCEVITILPETPFSKLPGNNTVAFDAVCEPDQISSFAPRALADLHGLRDLRLTGCAFLTLPTDLLPSPSALQNLTIYSTAWLGLDIPRGFFAQTPMLENLDIHGHGVSLPSGELCRLKHLRTLALKGNSFEDLFDVGIAEPFCLPALESLDLSFNELESLKFPLPETLRTLSLRRNKLSELDEQLWDLVALDVSHNQLESVTLPSTILEVLVLAHNALHHLPSSLMIPALTHLDVTHNRLVSVSEGLCENASSLTLLSLGDNLLQELGVAVFHGCGELRLLGLSNNALRTLLPSQFLHQTKLEILDLHGNDLSELGAGVFAGLSSLQTLNLSHNHLEVIEGGAWDGLAALQTLDLSGNRLAALPPNLHKLATLTLLDLNKNQLAAIDPQAFETMPTLEFLTLRDNLISYVPRFAFSGAPNLKLVNLAHNNISVLEYGAFRGIPNLQYLTLHNNSIADIDNVHLPNVKVLFLHENQLREVSPLWELPKSLEQLTLAKNQIHAVPDFSFRHLPNLLKVDLSSNELRTLSVRSMAMSNTRQRAEVKLARNPLSCECSTAFLKTINEETNRNLTYLADYDYLTCTTYNGSAYPVKALRESEFLCLYYEECDAGCECCEGGYCHCTNPCPHSCTCIRDPAWEYNRVDCTGQELFYDRKLPQSTTELVLTDRRLGVLVDQQFQSTEHLQRLVLRNISCSYIGQRAFQGLGTLQYLDLSKNQLSSFFNETFTPLRSLRHLNLESNQLRDIPIGTFASLAHLQELNLKANNLSYLRLGELLRGSHLSAVQLAGNPWECSCDRGLQFRDELIEWLPIIVDAKDMTCARGVDRELVPENITDLAAVPVLSVQFDKCMNATEILIDGSLSTTLTAGFSSAIVLLIGILALVFLGLYFRKLLRVWLFAKFGWRLVWGNSDNTPKKYDAFVSFSQKDLDFVLKELMPQMESAELPYRLCVHYRDWLVGECISINVAESVENSHRTILLLSDNFIQSEWCNYEFQTAHHQLLIERNRHLIVVLLQDEPPAGLDKDLQLYITTHTFLKRSDPWFWEKLKLAMPALTPDVIAHRQATPTHVQRLVEQQRRQMKKNNYKFLDGGVVEVAPDGTVID